MKYVVAYEINGALRVTETPYYDAFVTVQRILRSRGITFDTEEVR